MNFFSNNERLGRRVIIKVHPFLFLFLFVAFTAYSSPVKTSIPEELKSAYRLTMRLELDSCRSILSQDKSLKEHPFYYYTVNLADAIEIFITEDPTLYDVYDNTVDDRIARLEAMDKNDPYRLFALGEIYLQTSLLNAKFGEELSSVWNLRKAYFSLTENKEKFPEFNSTNKSLGLLHVMLGTVPSKYHWILNLLNMQGTVEQGMSELEELYSKNDLLSYESKLILHLLQTYIFEEGEASVAGLKELDANDPLFNYIFASVMIKNSRAAEAETLLNSTPDKTIQKKRFYLYYYLMGDINLMKGDYDQSIQYYNRFLDQFKGQNFIKDVYYKLSLCYYLKGLNEESKKYREETKRVGRSVIQADKYAAKMVNREMHFRGPSILKIRLATDGGYYETAQELVKDVHNPELFKVYEQRIEFIYRRARLSHKMGEIEEAIKDYETTIQDSPEELYFGANSALQLGYIYTDRNQYKLARQYFEKAISYRKHEYKTSIDNKALAALKKLEGKI